MKKTLYIFIPIFICSISIAQSVPNFTITSEGDTVNVVDENNMKQGFWKIFGNMKKLPDYNADQVVEQGEYANSRKQGVWTKFFASGKTKSEIAYKNSRPNGAYRTYFENGQVEEEGSWKNNRNTNDFKRYYENGQVSQQFAFSPAGKRDGEQIYFHENGQKMIVAQIKSGKEEKVTEYYEDGSLKAEKNFVDGKLDVANSKLYESTTPIIEKKPEGVIEVVTVSKDEYVNSRDFTGNGKYKMYNADRQISKDGMFNKYRFMEGKQYIYNNNGILTQVKLFKEGRYIGDGPLPKQ